jgi:hypothetical protein
MAGYASETDLRNAIWPGMFKQLFDDTGAGTVAVGATNVLQVLARAHAEVTSYLPRAYDVTPAELPNAVSQLLVSAEIDFAVAFAFSRRPELAEKLGANFIDLTFKRATKKMENIANTVQQIAPNDTPPAAKPNTLGGIVYDTGPRMLVDSSDGTVNGGDF